MQSYNKVILLGCVGSLNAKTFQDGGKVVEISLATNHQYKDSTGEKQTKTYWHRLVCRGKIADIVEQYAAKGDRLQVEGMLTNRKYTSKAGNEESITEILVTNVVLLGPSKMQVVTGTEPQAPVAPVRKNISAPMELENEADVTEDDLPS